MLRISLQRFAQHDTAIEGFTCAALLCPELLAYALFRNRASVSNIANFPSGDASFIWSSARIGGQKHVAKKSEASSKSVFTAI